MTNCRSQWKVQVYCKVPNHVIRAIQVCKCVGVHTLLCGIASVPQEIVKSEVQAHIHMAARDNG